MFTSVGDAVRRGYSSEIKDTPGDIAFNCASGIKLALQRAAMYGISLDVAEKRLLAARDLIMGYGYVCESPIERQMLPALIYTRYGEKFASFPAELHIPKIDRAPPFGDLVVIPQFALIRYRLDFAVMASFGDQRIIVAVECDGDDFHKNADDDRKRDAYLGVFGIKVFRFSGKEIANEPHEAASQVGQFIGIWRDSL